MDRVLKLQGRRKKAVTLARDQKQIYRLNETKSHWVKLCSIWKMDQNLLSS